MSTFTDWRHMNPDESARPKTREREALDTAVAAFLAGGGEVQEIPRGVGALDYTCTAGGRDDRRVYANAKHTWRMQREGPNR